MSGQWRVSRVYGNRTYFCQAIGDIEKYSIPGQRVTRSKWGYKGVEKTRSGNWRAYIGCRKKGNLLRLGYFPTPEEAAAAYDEAAKARYGEDAFLNFPLNAERRLLRASRDYCGLGHYLVGNTYFSNGRESCRTCTLESQKRLRARKRVAQ